MPKLIKVHESNLVNVTIPDFKPGDRLKIDFDEVADEDATSKKTKLNTGDLEGGHGRIYELTEPVTVISGEMTTEDLLLHLTNVRDGAFAIYAKQNEASVGLIIAYQDVGSEVQPQHDAYLFKYCNENADREVTASEITLIARLIGPEGSESGWLNRDGDATRIIIT